MPVNTTVAEQYKIEELSENEYDSESEQEPPDEIIMIRQRDSDDQDDSQDDDDDDDDAAEDGQTNTNIPITEQRGPVHERCVHGEINEMWVPLDRSEVFFSTIAGAQPPEPEPLYRYFLRMEWSEAEQLFTSALEFAEEVFSGWSPYRSPSPTTLDL